MAAVTAAVVAGSGALLSYYGAREQAKAARRAGELNAADAMENARLARLAAIEDEKQFRLSFRRDQGMNVASIGSSGIKMEGSALEVLHDNAAMAEGDALKIRRGGMIAARSYERQAQIFRETGRAQGRAAEISGAAGLLSGAAGTYNTGKTSGAF
jgi:hypothetical protein